MRMRLTKDIQGNNETCFGSLEFSPITCMGIGMVPDLIQATDIARYYSSLMKITWMSEKALGKDPFPNP